MPYRSPWAQSGEWGQFQSDMGALGGVVAKERASYSYSYSVPERGIYNDIINIYKMTNI